MTVDTSSLIGFCPYLGMADDPDTHYGFASGAQRCHAGHGPVEIDAAKQSRDCLTARHVTCSRYHTPTARERVSHLIPTPASDPLEVVRAATRRAYRPRRWLAGFAVLAGLAIGGLLLGPRLAGTASGGAPSPAAAGAGDQPLGAVLEATARPSGGAAAPGVSQPGTTLPPSPMPASSPGATTGPSPSPIPTSSPGATTVPSPSQDPRIHIVHRGETLTSIGQRFGVSVDALVKANHIKDRNLIVTGQRLVIPRP